MPTDLKLAITTIGDLLLYDKITQDIDGKAISNIILKIPKYQRHYKWKAKNIIQLFDDILEAKNANKETYRVGTLILHQEGERIYNIVDGQQRTITFSLLLKALNSDSDIKFLEQPLSDNQYNTRNVPNNSRTLERRVKSNADDKEELFNYIQKHCELVVVITYDISEAFQFFDSQNSRGKKLYPHDLLKAYHLREMNDMDPVKIEKTVKDWEDLNQKTLSALFSEYLYRVKEWVRGDKALELTEDNIHKFKGVTRKDDYPYAQFYRGAYAYSDMVNYSAIPFKEGIRNHNTFQLDAPIIAGKSFFDYTNYYFEILKNIQNNGKNECFNINDNEILKTLDLRKYKNGIGNLITRLLFDTAILLYVDRFCPEEPTKKDSTMLDQFVMFAFIWAYSLRAQYENLGWLSAQNYIMGNGYKINSFNIYKVIMEAHSPAVLISILSDIVKPLPYSKIVANKKKMDIQDGNNTFLNYLHYFKLYNFMEDDNDN